MKSENVIFEEYNDNNLNHTKAGPDYGDYEGKLKWTAKQINYSLKCYFPINLKYKIHNIIFN